ncbi:MAG TPA: hypothetical protein GX497_12040 [Bacillus bacterium]|nr:hypothetical protein [Bacillus sp. (in: firmicutes)]
MYFWKNIIVIIGFIFILAGCGKSLEEEIYSHLEKAVSLEAVFEEQQQPLVELEKKEQDLYEKIIQLGMSEFAEINVLSEEAIAIVDERESRIKKEKESIDSSKKAFLSTEAVVGNLKDEKLKGNAEELMEIMNKRYDAYNQLYEYYQDAIRLDRELYKMFQKEELTLDQLEGQVKKINGMYDSVVQANEKFNELTETYNKKKKEFYLAAGLNVVFEEKQDHAEATKTK